ncbi:L-fucose kinase isoform X1 [Brienomyrus brachyistius]|uniref:L-fucose kinase isoform X1 n=1 Tax=Brienomyrus brachyistius TaxID=42636 RepID=UPI0020B2B981|nr:L-fucose kinase isoform X1 [Brienomyrus brachyistius]
MSHLQPLNWTVVVLTCQHKDSVYAIQKELELRQQCGHLPQEALLLIVSDPEQCLGSGGATLNALLVATEHLSARAGHTVVTADVLDDAHILILHTGRDFPWDSCGRAFSWLPAQSQAKAEQPVCCLDLLLDCLTKQICPGSPPGVWVCSTDAMLTLPTAPAISWEGFSGVRVVSLPGSVSYATNHGVYLTDGQDRVRDIIYRGPKDRIRQAMQTDGKVPLVSGPVFFCRQASERLLQTHVCPPLDGCTYMGMDSGAPSLQISLFLDVLLCLCLDVNEKQFMDGERQGCISPSGPQGAPVRSARAVLWKMLRGIPLTIVYVPDGCYDYLTVSGDEHIRRITERESKRETLSHVQKLQLVSEDSKVINSVLEGDVSVLSGTVIQHCCLQGPMVIPSGCFLSGLDFSASALCPSLPSNIIIQRHRVQLGDLKLIVFTVLGRHDDLEASCADPAATFLNEKWSSYCSRTGIQPGEIWGTADKGAGPPCLLDARLFPVLLPSRGAVGLEGVEGLLEGAGRVKEWREAWKLSLREVLSCTDQQEELHWRRELFFQAAQRRTVDTLKGRTEQSLLPSIRATVLGGQQENLLQTLDFVAAGSSEDLGVAARCLACVADVLGCMAGEGKGGLRSGPAANPCWAPAFALLEKGDLLGGVKALAVERKNWLNRPDLLVRAARHYEGAGQVLLRQAVMSAQRFVAVSQGEVPPIGEWQEFECPARLDLSGGWTDTPPIAFECGGTVVNVAVKVDGERPIGARARRIREPRLLLVSTSGGQDCRVTTETMCETLRDLEDHCQPQAPGALLKAVCVCSGLVTLSTQQTLVDQLLQGCGGGLELHSWSLLPHGSGMGTSSILAGAALAAVYRCMGRMVDTNSLIHAVLHLEQTLTTGGGWQDQVGGLVGGVKLARSSACLPLKVQVEKLNLSEDFLQSLQQHLLLVYTGKTRLARNLLQDVVRSWYSRLPSIVENIRQLVSNAEECAQACIDGSLPRLGNCVNRYWQQKKVMAAGCEPAAVRLMMDSLQPLALGQSLAGAGGGGFLFLLTSEPMQKERVREVLYSTQGLGDFSVHSVEVDLQGISFQKQSEIGQTGAVSEAEAGRSL